MSGGRGGVDETSSVGEGGVRGLLARFSESAASREPVPVSSTSAVPEEERGNVGAVAQRWAKVDYSVKDEEMAALRTKVDKKENFSDVMGEWGRHDSSSVPPPVPSVSATSMEVPEEEKSGLIGEQVEEEEIDVGEGAMNETGAPVVPQADPVLAWADTGDQKLKDTAYLPYTIGGSTYSERPSIRAASSVSGAMHDSSILASMDAGASMDVTEDGTEADMEEGGDDDDDEDVELPEDDTPDDDDEDAELPDDDGEEALDDEDDEDVNLDDPEDGDEEGDDYDGAHEEEGDELEDDDDDGDDVAEDKYLDASGTSLQMGRSGPLNLERDPSSTEAGLVAEGTASSAQEIVSTAEEGPVPPHVETAKAVTGVAETSVDEPEKIDYRSAVVLRKVAREEHEPDEERIVPEWASMKLKPASRPEAGEEASKIDYRAEIGAVDDPDAMMEAGVPVDEDTVDDAMGVEEAMDDNDGDAVAGTRGLTSDGTAAPALTMSAPPRLVDDVPSADTAPVAQTTEPSDVAEHGTQERDVTAAAITGGGIAGAGAGVAAVVSTKEAGAQSKSSPDTSTPLVERRRSRPFSGLLARFSSRLSRKSSAETGGSSSGTSPAKSSSKKSGASDVTASTVATTVVASGASVAAVATADSGEHEESRVMDVAAASRELDGDDFEIEGAIEVDEEVEVDGDGEEEGVVGEEVLVEEQQRDHEEVFAEVSEPLVRRPTGEARIIGLSDLEVVKNHKKVEAETITIPGLSRPKKHAVGKDGFSAYILGNTARITLKGANKKLFTTTIKGHGSSIVDCSWCSSSAKDGQLHVVATSSDDGVTLLSFLWVEMKDGEQSGLRLLKSHPIPPPAALGPGAYYLKAKLTGSPTNGKVALVPSVGQRLRVVTFSAEELFNPDLLVEEPPVPEAVVNESPIGSYETAVPLDGSRPDLPTGERWTPSPPMPIVGVGAGNETQEAALQVPANEHPWTSSVAPATVQSRANGPPLTTDSTLLGSDAAVPGYAYAPMAYSGVSESPAFVSDATYAMEGAAVPSSIGGGEAMAMDAQLDSYSVKETIVDPTGSGLIDVPSVTGASLDRAVPLVSESPGILSGAPSGIQTPATPGLAPPLPGLETPGTGNGSTPGSMTGAVLAHVGIPDREVGALSTSLPGSGRLRTSGPLAVGKLDSTADRDMTPITGSESGTVTPGTPAPAPEMPSMSHSGADTPVSGMTTPGSQYPAAAPLPTMSGADTPASIDYPEGYSGASTPGAEIPHAPALPDMPRSGAETPTYSDYSGSFSGTVTPRLPSAAPALPEMGAPSLPGSGDLTPWLNSGTSTPRAYDGPPSLPSMSNLDFQQYAAPPTLPDMSSTAGFGSFRSGMETPSTPGEAPLLPRFPGGGDLTPGGTSISSETLHTPGPAPSLPSLGVSGANTPSYSSSAGGTPLRTGFADRSTDDFSLPGPPELETGSGLASTVDTPVLQTPPRVAATPPAFETPHRFSSADSVSLPSPPKLPNLQQMADIPPPPPPAAPLPDIDEE